MTFLADLVVMFENSREVTGTEGRERDGMQQILRARLKQGLCNYMINYWQLQL